jgi:hypothetical protein
MRILLLCALLLSAARAEEPVPWERAFAEQRHAWKTLPESDWKRLLPRDGPDLIRVALASDLADAGISRGSLERRSPKRDSADFSYADRSGSDVRVPEAFRQTLYSRVRAEDILRDGAPWLEAEVDGAKEDPFVSLTVRLAPERGLTGSAAAMALAALAQDGLLAPKSPLRNRHLGDVVAAWVDEKLSKLPRARARRVLRVAPDASGRLVFKVIDETDARIVSRASIHLHKLEERL